MGEKGRWEKPGQQDKICKMKKDGKIDEVALLEVRPIVFCNKCKTKSNDPSLLCNPRALKPGKAV